MPIESVVCKRQRQYYEALENSGADGEGTLFAEFMLKAILEACKNIEKSNQKITIAELAAATGLSESGGSKRSLQS